MRPVSDLRWKRWLPLGALLLLTLCYWVGEMRTLNHDYSYGDEGFIAEGARRVLKGEVPCRDFFFAVTPGALYFFAGFLKIFGPTFFALRLGVVVTALLILCGAWWALHRLGQRARLPFVMACAYLAHYGATSWFVASHHWLVLALILFSFGLLLGENDSPSRRWEAAGAGALAALAAFTFQHKGGLWIVAATIALLLIPGPARRQALAWFWGGLLAVALPLIVVFVALAGWDRLVADLLLFPLQQYHKIGAHGIHVLEDLRKGWDSAHSSWLYRNSLSDWIRIATWHVGYLGYLLIYLLPLIGAAGLVVLRRRQALPPRQLALLAAFFIASYLGALHRLSDSTMVFAAPAAVVVIIVWLQSPGTRGELCSPVRHWACIGWLSLFGFISVGQGLLTLTTAKVPTQTPAGVVASALAGEAQTIEGVTGYLREHLAPGEKIFAYHYLAMYYFLMQADNPTPYDLITFPMNTQEQLDHAQALLEKDQTRLVLWDYLTLDNDSLGRYLSANYEVKARFKYVAVMERRSRR